MKSFKKFYAKYIHLMDITGMVMNVHHYFEKMQLKSKNCATTLSALKWTLATAISMLNIKLCYGLFLFGCFSLYREMITGQDGWRCFIWVPQETLREIKAKNCYWWLWPSSNTRRFISYMRKRSTWCSRLFAAYWKQMTFFLVSVHHLQSCSKTWDSTTKGM